MSDIDNANALRPNAVPTGRLSRFTRMGGLATGCTEATTNVFLEAAYFDPVRTALTGRALKINSDARYRV